MWNIFSFGKKNKAKHLKEAISGIEGYYKSLPDSRVRRVGLNRFVEPAPTLKKNNTNI